MCHVYVFVKLFLREKKKHQGKERRVFTSSPVTQQSCIWKFNQLLTADASELQTNKMAARRFITTPQRLLCISTLQ